MFYLMKLKNAIFSNFKVTKIEGSTFFGTPGINASVMLCYVMLCYVMLCYVMLCYVTKFIVIMPFWF